MTTLMVVRDHPLAVGRLFLYPVGEVIMDKQLILSMAQEIGDPFGDLYYEKDMVNGGKGEVSVKDTRTGRVYTWFRDKSNATVDAHGFSFYYALHVFDDRHAFLSTNRRNPNPKEARNLVIGKPFGDQGEDLLVVVHIKNEGNTVKIISAYPTDNPHYRADYEWSVEIHQSADMLYQKNVDFLAKQMSCL